MSVPEEGLSGVGSSFVESSAGPSRPLSRTSQRSSSSTSSRKGKERAIDVEDPEVAIEASKPAKSVRTVTTNQDESSDGEEDEEDDDEEEEP